MMCSKSVVTKLLARDRNCYHFLLSISQPFSPQLRDETILTSTARSCSAQKAQLSAFTVKLVEFGQNGRQSQTVACCVVI